MEKTVIYRPHTGGIFKATSPSAFKGYLVRYGARGDRDLEKEFFSAKTYLMRKAGYPVVGAPVNFQHGLLKEFGSVGIGLFDFADEDEVGLFVRGQMFDLERYKEMLKEIGRVKGLKISDAQLNRKADLALTAVTGLVVDIPLRQSMGADVQTWEVSEEGHIDQAGIIHGALTPTPADDKNPVVQFVGMIKSAFALENERKTFDMATPTGSIATPSLGEAATQEPIEASTALQTDDESAKVPQNNEDTNNQDEETTMTPEEVMALIKESIPAIAAAVAEEMGMADDEMSDEEKAAVVDETAEEVKAGHDDEDEDDDDTEEAKSIRVASVLGILAKNAANALDKKRSTKAAAISKAASGAANNWKNGQSGQSKAGGAVTGAQQYNVGENLKYAHLSASDMALAVKLRMAPALSKGIPVQPEMYFSEEFYKTLANKAYQFAEQTPYGKNAKSAAHTQSANKANYHLKSLLPFKADELNASVITGQGLEWVAEFWSTDLWERERFERHYDMMVSKGMFVEQLPQGIDTAWFPLEGADPVAYMAGEARSIDATGRLETTVNINAIGTGRTSLTPKEIKIGTAVTTILTEDSIINTVQNVNRQMHEAMMDTRDKLMVNGDTETGTTNINKDGVAPATGLATPYYIASDGYRKVALANGIDATNALNLATYRLTLEELDPELRQFYQNMVFMIDPQTEMASLAIPDIAHDDVRRTLATVTSGRLLNIFGIDVLVNGWLPQTDTDGKVTSTGNVADRGTVMLAYPKYWGVAYKRNITLETDRDIYSGADIYVLSMRIGFIERGTNAATMSYNVATTAA